MSRLFVSPFSLNQRKQNYRVYQSTTCWDTIFMRIQSWWRGGETYVWEDSRSESKSRQTATRMKWLATISGCVFESVLEIRRIWLWWNGKCCLLMGSGFPSSRLVRLLITLSESGCDGRVVKALDLKFNGVSPRRFEPCSQRWSFALSMLALITLFLCWI